jgi:hypothetical protein
MSEGELKERLIHLLNTFQPTDCALTDILDEVKAEFLKNMSFTDAKHIREWIVYNKLSKEKYVEDLVIFLEWFLKWFGEP